MMFKTSLVAPMTFPEASLLEGINKASHCGADGIEFFDWKDRDLDEIATKCREHDCDVTAIPAKSGSPPTAPHLTRPNNRTAAIKRLREAIDAATTLECSSLIVTVGEWIPNRPVSEQREAIVAVIERVAPIAEEADVDLLLEPLNAHVNHPGYFLVSLRDAVGIIDAVDSDAVGVLLDVYHHWVSHGALPALDQHVNQIRHVHVADAPGRQEPGTGEVPIARFLKRLTDAGYDGIVGGEYLPSEAPEPVAREVVRLLSASR